MRTGEISQGLCKDASVYVCGIQTEPCTGAIVEVSKYKEELSHNTLSRLDSQEPFPKACEV